MNKIVEALKSVGVFYLATAEGDQPRVRPFGSVTEFEGSVYICTNNTKACYAQIMSNPKIELCGMDKKGGWLRLSATAVRDDRDAARAAMLKDPTGPSRLYSLGDGIFEVLRLENIRCTRYSFSAAPETIEA